MIRKTAAITGLVFVGVSLLLMAGNGFGAPAGSEKTLTLVERATSDNTAHVSAKSDALGDIMTFNNAIYDRDDKRLMGHDNGYCVRTEVGKFWECHWTLQLAAGQITVDGPFADEGDSVLVVTGGTGAYLGAVGKMDLHARDPKATEYDFTYHMKL